MKIVVRKRDAKSHFRALHWSVDASTEQCGSFQSVLSAVAAKEIIYWELVWEAWKVQNGPEGRDKSIIGVWKAMSLSIHSIMPANQATVEVKVVP